MITFLFSRIRYSADGPKKYKKLGIFGYFCLFVSRLFVGQFFSVTVLVAKWLALLRARREVAGSAPASALPFLLLEFPAFTLSLTHLIQIKFSLTSSFPHDFFSLLFPRCIAFKIYLLYIQI